MRMCECVCANVWIQNNVCMLVHIANAHIHTHSFGMHILWYTYNSVHERTNKRTRQSNANKQEVKEKGYFLRFSSLFFFFFSVVLSPVIKAAASQKIFAYIWHHQIGLLALTENQNRRNNTDWLTNSACMCVRVCVWLKSHSI